MSELQQQAFRLINELSDDNVSFLIEIIQRLMPQKTQAADIQPPVTECMELQAFKRLDAARVDIRQYLPKDFNPARELEEAKAERYGSIN